MTEEIIQKKEYWIEFISFSKKHCNYTDEDLAEHIVKMVEKAINYTHCCTELKGFELWKSTVNLNTDSYSEMALREMYRDTL